MKKILLLVCFPLLPAAGGAGRCVRRYQRAGRFPASGDQDRRGYYWDGYDWRPPQWWHAHRAAVWVSAMRAVCIGTADAGNPPPRGYEHREPERSGNPFHGDRDNRDRRHDDRGDHDRRDDGRGQPYPPGNAGPHR